MFQRFFLFIFLLICTTALKGSVIDAGDLTWHTTSAPKPIAPISQDKDIQSLALQAFKIHGGFEVTAPDEALFDFQIEKVNNQQVQLTITSGHPRQKQFQEVVSGKDIQEATLKACDLAVTKTLGIPGFFAGKIAFVGERGDNKEIYESDLFFKKVKQVTHDKSNVVMPRWSPRGNQLLYTGYYQTGFPDIFLVDLESGQRTPFAAYRGTNSGGTFSPNGAAVAMFLSSTGHPELYVSDTEGNKPIRITKNKSLKSSPTWSPDSRKIAFACDALGSPQIFEISAKGGAMKRLTKEFSSYCVEPQWNPRKNSQIVFTASVSRSHQIALYDEEAGKCQYLTNPPGNAMEPWWLSDGRHVIFTRRDGPNKQLYILDTETGKQTALSPNDFGNASLASFVYVKG